ncbi:MAG: hypothetical protein HQL02_06230 [Nitrospirae bacterium]|nr:hypothetical protein [Nitrospirota bacterium]
MLSKRVMSLTGLLALMVFMCVSCASESVRSGGGGDDRFYKGQRAEIVDILRASREEMLNNNFDNAMAKANEAKEKSKVMKDDVMLFSSGSWVMAILVDADKPRSFIDNVPIELLESGNFESLYYGSLLVMYDINAFDLRGKDPLDALGFRLSGKTESEFATLFAEECKKKGDIKFANLVDTMFTSYFALLEASKDNDNNKVNEYKPKILDACDKIVSLTDDFKIFEGDNEGIFLMSRVYALYLKLVVVGFDRDMATYKKTAKKFAEFEALAMPKR